VYGGLKSNASVYSAFLRVANRLPARLVYRGPYLAIQGLLDREDLGEDVEPRLAWRLASVLRTAITRVPYYRNLELGIRADDIGPDTAYEVLSRFPYLERSSVMREPESFVSDAFEMARLTAWTTSGSTGEGLKGYRTASLVSAEAAFFHHEWAKVGYVRRAKVVRMAVEGRRLQDEEPCRRSGDRLLVSPFHFNERWVHRIYDDINAFRPRFIHAYPSCFEYLADYMDRAGLRLSGLSGIFLASERVTERQLNLARKVFEDTTVRFHYGLGERTNLAWGSRGESGISYKFECAYGCSENLTHAGDAREIVGTSYWNEVMPLIRYRTQDYGEIRDGVIRNLDGRQQEFLVARSGAKVPALAFDMVDFAWDFVEAYQVVQNERGKLELHIMPRPQYDDSIGGRIVASQQAELDGMFDVSLVVTDHVERTPFGKMRNFVVNVSD
jgi:phenylacetate-CoA ligase